MDSLTHTVLGACIGELIAGKKMGKKAMFWGAVANNLPDIDVLTSLWMNPADSLLAHRGFTHSILFAFLGTFLLARLLKSVNRNPQVTLKDWMWIFGTGLFFHIFIDAMTAYGTGWYEPFSHNRVAYNLLFIVDPVYMLAPLIATIVLLMLPQRHRQRKSWSRFGIIASSVYVLLTLFNKLEVDAALKPALEKNSLTNSAWFTTPTPFNNLLWFVVAPGDSGYFLGYRSVFDRGPETDFELVTKGDSLLPAIREQHDVAQLIRFSQGYYTLEKVNDTLFLNDLRFGQTGGWYRPHSPFVFRFALNHQEGTQLVIQRGRMKATGKEALSGLWKRMWANEAGH